MRFIKLFEDFNGDDIVEEIEDLFLELTSDYDFEVEVETDIYIIKNGESWEVPDISKDGQQRLRSNIEYNIGLYLNILFPKEFGDLTYEFKTIISQLRGSGWELAKIETLPYYHSDMGSDLESLSNSRVNGKYTSELRLYFAGHETKKFTDIGILNHYKISDWEEIDGVAFIEMEKGGLAGLFIPTKSNYYSYLVDGEPLDYFAWGGGYRPKVGDLVNQYSDISIKNKEKLVEVIVEECGGVDKFYDRFSYCLPSEYEGKVDISTISRNGKGIDLGEIFENSYEEFSKFSDIIDEIINTISDWSVSAHEDENSKEIDDEFEDLLNKHITYTTFKKNVERWMNLNGERKSYEEEVDFYRIKFDPEWLVDNNMDLLGSSLSELFCEWCLETIGKVDINPRLSDYGHVDRESLNAEISSIIDGYEKNNYE